MKIFKIIISIVLIVIIGVSIVLLIRNSLKSFHVVDDQQKIVLSFSYPNNWTVASDPSGDPPTLNKLRSILLTLSGGNTPENAIRFWDNPNVQSSEIWARNAAAESEWKGSPQEVKIGENTYWMLNSASQPGLIGTTLYHVLGNRMMVVEVDTKNSLVSKPYFTPEVLTWIQSMHM